MPSGIRSTGEPKPGRRRVRAGRFREHARPSGVIRGCNARSDASARAEASSSVSAAQKPRGAAASPTRCSQRKRGTVEINVFCAAGSLRGAATEATPVHSGGHAASVPMEDFGGFEAGDAWEADEAEPVDPDAFPCFVNPVAGFTPRAEVEARAAERFADAEPEDEERRAPVHPSTSTSTPSLPAAVTRLARRGDPRAPPRPDAAQRHAADPALPPPAVAGHRRGGGHFITKSPRLAVSRARGGGGGGPRTYRRGVERFCAVLLRWSVRSLAEHEHDPNAVGLPPCPSRSRGSRAPTTTSTSRAPLRRRRRAPRWRAPRLAFFFIVKRARSRRREALLLLPLLP